jgi:hypothetical protein
MSIRKTYGECHLGKVYLVSQVEKRYGSCTYCKSQIPGYFLEVPVTDGNFRGTHNFSVCDDACAGKSTSLIESVCKCGPISVYDEHT